MPDDFDTVNAVRGRPRRWRHALSDGRDIFVCRCGTRLARDNMSGVCGRCSRDVCRLTTPPDVPVGFWYADDMRAAFAQRHRGKVIRAYRHHPFHDSGPLSQDLVAGWMGQTQAQLSRLENGPGLRDISRLAAWATLLAMPAQMLWFALPAPPPSSELTPSRGADHRLALIQSLRFADRQIGGAHLYATVSGCLSLSAVPAPRQAQDPQLLASTAVLCEMAGWMAHDAGADDHARRHLRQAAVLARSSGDGHLTAQIQASLSHHDRQQGAAAQALGQVRSGLAALHDATPHGRLTARLLVMQACALAASGRAAEASRTVDDAEIAFSGGCSEPSPWLSPFDEAALTMEVARCLLHLGDLSQAEGRLRTVLVERRAERIRSRALARLLLVTVLLAQDRLDEACHAVADTIDSTLGLGSAVVVAHLRHATVLLRSHAHRSNGIPPLLDRIRDTVESRAWIGILDGDHRVGG